MSVQFYKELIKSRLSEKRYEHSLNVAKEAVNLAKMYGEDVKKAEIAGVLHDINKEAALEEQLKIINDYGVELDDVEKKYTKLWHSISGSIYVKKELKINDEDIIKAIRYHTSARKGMSKLEKIIYLADFISEERDFDGVEIIREKAKLSLDEGVIEGLSFTIKDLVKKRVIIYKDTFEAYNDILDNMED